MAAQVDAFVGREQELRDIQVSLAQARDGFGGTWFLVGDAGIGKSRLTEETSRVAASLGFVPLFGRCWEAGGAPSFWPWVTILRTLFRGRDPVTQLRWLGNRAAVLSQLLPEFAAESTSTPPRLDTQAARFQLMDAVASCLADAAIEVPLLIVLEDLHAADPSSVTLLDFVARQVPTMRALVVGTYRPVAVEIAGIGETLARLSQRSTTVHLKRLLPDQVAELVGGLVRGTPSQEALDALQVATDGNPLFVVEMCRWSNAHGGVAQLEARSTIPPNLRRTIRERLAALPPQTRTRLELAAVIGREFRPQLLHDAEPTGDPRADLLPAMDAAILVETLPGQWRFAHGLIRDALYSELATNRREALHLCVANALQPYAERQPLTHAAELSHHLQHGGVGARERALDAAQRAAQFACQQLGFDEASVLYRRALDVLDAIERETVTNAVFRERRCNLLLRLGNAQIHAGKSDGKASCLEAAAIARELGSAELLAEAALEYGVEFTFAMVDPTLVQLLEESLRLLPTDPSSLRARVLARLAAALQPSSEPRGPIEMAQLAVEMAHQTASPTDLLRTLRSAGSALMDLAKPHERLVVNREHAALAQRLGDAVEVVRAEMRLVFDNFELGDLASAEASISRANAASEALGYDRFRGRAIAMTSMLALWRGDFARARALQAEALKFSLRASDANGPRCAALQRIGFAFLEAEVEDYQNLKGELTLELGDTELTRAICDLLFTTLAVKLNLPLPLTSARMDQVAQLLMHSHDLWLLDMLASCATILSQPIVREAFEVLQPEGNRFASGGLAAMVWERPVARALALFADRLGESSLSDDYFAQAIEQLVGAGGLPHEAWTRYEWAMALERRGLNLALQREQLTRALELAVSLGMSGLSARCTQELERVGMRPSDDCNEPAVLVERESNRASERRLTGAFTLTPEGDYFCVARAGERWQLRDSKGVRWLWRLVNEPGREFHVLDLSSTEPVDGGDSGAVLDAMSQKAYRERLTTLQTELAEAESYNDWARVERVRHEREQLARELANAFGMGGRERRSGSAIERARVNVQRRIKDAILRIAKHDPNLGRHLERSIRTGTYCSYEPE